MSTAFSFNRGMILAAIALGLADVALAATTYDVNNSSAWTTGTGAGANSSVTYGFDYSSLGIPQAPGSATTTAMVLRANTNSGAAAAQGITVSPNGLSLAGDYVIRAMMWGNTYGGDPALPPGWGVDGTAGDQPQATLVAFNLAREIGLWEKQSSCYTQFKSSENVIMHNVMYNGPRAVRTERLAV